MRRDLDDEDWEPDIPFIAIKNQELEVPTKRKRGRPPKKKPIPFQSVTQSIPSGAVEEPPVKRKRGRPRNNPIEPRNEEPPVKRKRGRPRKNPVSDSNQSTPQSSPSGLLCNETLEEILSDTKKQILLENNFKDFIRYLAGIALKKKPVPVLFPFKGRAGVLQKIGLVWTWGFGKKSFLDLAKGCPIVLLKTIYSNWYKTVDHDEIDSAFPHTNISKLGNKMITFLREKSVLVEMEKETSKTHKRQRIFSHIKWKLIPPQQVNEKLKQESSTLNYFSPTDDETADEQEDVSIEDSDVEDYLTPATSPIQTIAVSEVVSKDFTFCFDKETFEHQHHVSLFQKFVNAPQDHNRGTRSFKHV